MAFEKTYSVSCDLTDKDGNTGRFVGGEVKVGGFDGEEAAVLNTRAHFESKGVRATNIRATRKR